MKQETSISEKVSPHIVAEVREYTDLPIMLIDEPFAKNHLFCVRGKHCEFAEYQNFVHVYIYPPVSIDKEQKNNFTAGPWKIQGPKVQEDFGGQTYWTILPEPYKSKADPYKVVGFYYPYSGHSKEEQEANAKLINAAPDLLDALNEIPMECDHKYPHLSACWVCKAKEAIKKATK